MNALFAALATVLFAFTAHATDVTADARVMTADFANIHMDPKSELRVVDGSITVNLVSNEISLTLQPAWSCPPGRYCATVMPQPRTLTLPIKSVKTSSCGDTYIAELNELPVDGLHNTIKVTDWTLAICDIFIASAIQVEQKTRHYDRINGGLVTYHHSFSAKGWKNHGVEASN